MQKANNIFIIILSISILLLIITFALTTYFFKQQNTIYSNEAMTIMKKLNILDEVDQNMYSETLDVFLTNDKFQKEYTKEYQKINYIEKENFLETVNVFLKLQYTPEEINKIFTYLNDKNIDKLTKLDKINLKDYYQIQNFEVDKIARYETYKEENNTTLEDAVLKVNIGLDHDFYTNIDIVNNQNEYTVLVNKYHSIDKYAPNDLKSLSYDSSYKLRAKAADAFEEMVSAAKLDNVYLRPYSAYRSYTTQVGLYNNYVAKDGKAEADTYSARPGHSEHQTGLAVDIWTDGFNYLKDSDATWLNNNSYKYGFIVRYTKENIGITGYIEEPWHLRYIGKDVATDVVEKKLTYDEYYDLYLK